MVIFHFQPGAPLIFCFDLYFSLIFFGCFCLFVYLLVAEFNVLLAGWLFNSLAGANWLLEGWPRISFDGADWLLGGRLYKSLNGSD